VGKDLEVMIWFLKKRLVASTEFKLVQEVDRYCCFLVTLGCWNW
jgi:hypothetical protein